MADRESRTVLVIGLGRFGSALALELEALGHEVLAVDERESIVQAFAGEVTHCVVANATDPAVLTSLGVADIRHAVVAIGDDVEASILCVSELEALEVDDIWAKAKSESHARILKRVGARHVVFPERDMGSRVAHQVTGQMMDYIPIGEDFALVETRAPAAEIGKTLQEAQLRARYEVTVVSVRPLGGKYTYTTPDTVLERNASMLVAGPKEAVERFAASL